MADPGSNVPEYRVKTPVNERPQNLPIEIEIEFEKINIIDIDDSKQEFRAEVHLSFSYEKPESSSKVEDWDPQIYFPNCSEFHHKYQILDTEDDPDKVIGGYIVDATFIEIMDLSNFPFDLQKLHVEVSTRRPETEVTIKGCRTTQDVVGFDAVFKAAKEWIVDEAFLRETVEINSQKQETKRQNVAQRLLMDKRFRRKVADVNANQIPQDQSLANSDQVNLTSHKSKLSQLSGLKRRLVNSNAQRSNRTKEMKSKLLKQNKRFQTSLYAKRKWTFYFINVLLVTAVIMGLTFTSGTVDSDAPGDKLTVTITLLLTSVAFKSAVGSRLPDIAYLTFLDKYVLACIAVQVAIALQNSVSTLFRNTLKEWSDFYDLISMPLLGSAVVWLNLAFFIKAVLIIYRNNKMVKQVKEEESKNQTKQELDKADGAVEPSNKTALVDLEQTVY